MSSITVKHTTAIITIVIIVAASLGAGILTAKYALPSQASTNFPSGRQIMFNGPGQNGQFGQAARTGRNGGVGAGSAMISGELLKKDAGSLSLKTRDGSSLLVLVTSSTRATKMVDGSINDLSVGQEIVVNGTTNSDNSITAQMVQVRQQPPAQPQP
ncbi:MAG: hypothetical protein PHC53_04390 [Patescibacteria group bacterium]|nr:hypothetical protein [Patescibacteria group bacterium]